MKNITLEGNALRVFLNRHGISVEDVAKKANIATSAIYRMTANKATTHHAKTVYEVIDAIEALAGVRFNIVDNHAYYPETDTGALWQTLNTDDLITEMEFQLWRIRCYLLVHDANNPFIQVINSLIDVESWRDAFPQYVTSPTLPMTFINKETDE